MNLYNRTAVYAVLLLLTSCATQTVQQQAELQKNKRWILLPLVNFAQAPQAGERAERILASLLRIQGVHQLTEYPAESSNDQFPFLNDQLRYRQAEQWAKTQQADYWISGSISEWRYKNGLDGEPAVGITLRILDASTGEILWTSTAAKTGWGQQSVAYVANDLIADLVQQIPIN